MAKVYRFASAKNNNNNSPKITKVLPGKAIEGRKSQSDTTYIMQSTLETKFPDAISTWQNFWLRVVNIRNYLAARLRFPVVLFCLLALHWQLNTVWCYGLLSKGGFNLTSYHNRLIQPIQPIQDIFSIVKSCIDYLYVG